MIYVGTSWKNAQWLDIVHKLLHSNDIETWDFRKLGFWWKDVEADSADPYNFLSAKASTDAFEYDKLGMDKMKMGLFLLPAGISTAIELGYMAGQGKPTVLWGQPRDRMDIMWNMAEVLLTPSRYNLEQAVDETVRVYREKFG